MGVGRLTMSAPASIEDFCSQNRLQHCLSVRRPLSTQFPQILAENRAAFSSSHSGFLRKVPSLSDGSPAGPRRPLLLLNAPRRSLCRSCESNAGCWWPVRRRLGRTTWTSTSSGSCRQQTSPTWASLGGTHTPSWKQQNACLRALTGPCHRRCPVLVHHGVDPPHIS